MLVSRSAGALTPGVPLHVGIVPNQPAHQLEHLVTRRLHGHLVLEAAAAGMRVLKVAQVRVDDEVGGRGDGLRLRDDAVVHLLEMLLHLVRAGELFSAHRAGEHLPLLALVIQEGVALEAVFVLETLLQLHLVALQAAVGTVAGDLRVFEQVEPANGHVLQTL